MAGEPEGREVGSTRLGWNVGFYDAAMGMTPLRPAWVGPSLLTTVALATPLACTSGPSGLTVGAASSLSDLLPAMASAAGVGDVSWSFAGSQTLVAQVQAGAPLDLVITADAASMQRLVSEGLVGTPVELGEGSLAVLIAPQASDRGIRSIDALTRGDLDVVLAAPEVPLGRYSHDALEAAGVAVQPRVTVTSAAGVTIQLRLGEADVGIGYASDLGVHRTGGFDGFEIDHPVEYLAAVVVDGRRAEAERLLAELLNDAADSVLEAGGISPS